LTGGRFGVVRRERKERRKRKDNAETLRTLRNAEEDKKLEGAKREAR